MIPRAWHKARSVFHCRKKHHGANSSATIAAIFYAAVVAFGAACWAMLQVAFAPGHRALSGLTLLMAVAVGVVAATGGLLSLARWNAVFGSRLELVATTIGIGWLVVFGIVRAARLVTRPSLATLASPDAA